MKQYIPKSLRQIALVGIVALGSLMTACNDKKTTFEFTNLQEAVGVCRQELADIKPLKTADMDKLTEITATWVVLQDSVHSLMMRDTTLAPHDRAVMAYFGVADSIRREIQRLALSEKRSLSDVFTLKVNTVKKMNIQIDKRDMATIREVLDKMIDNAETCRNDIKASKPLTQQDSNNYRWLLLQPYLTIDNYATSVLSGKQLATLTKIADELPELLAYVDGKDYEHSPKEETEKLANVLSEYFLKSYLTSVL